MSSQAAFIEHHARASAYLACCQPSGTIGSRHFSGFIDSYSSVKDQMKIIDECATQLDDDHQNKCTDSLQRLADARNRTEQ